MKNLKTVYEKGRNKLGSYDFYNLMEKVLIEGKLTETEESLHKELDIEKTLVKDIKGLSMLLSRFKPADWNKFLDVVIKWTTFQANLPLSWALDNNKKH